MVKLTSILGLFFQISCCASFLLPSYHFSTIRRYNNQNNRQHREQNIWTYSATKSETAANAERNDLAQTLIQTARSMGQIGSKLPQSDQDKLLQLSKTLAPYTDPAPAQKSLSGKHELIYSASAGGSAGGLGPFVGKVAQRFLSDNDFINEVTFGPGLLKFELEAERKVLDEKRIRVKFVNTKVQLMGVEVLKKETKGQGVWDHLFSGIVEIDGKPTLLRILLTPSLFIIQQKVE